MNVKAYSTYSDYVKGSYSQAFTFESAELANSVAYQLRQAGRYVCLDRGTPNARFLRPILSTAASTD